jgi:hypothetical protein
MKHSMVLLGLRPLGNRGGGPALPLELKRKNSRCAVARFAYPIEPRKRGQSKLGPGSVLRNGAISQ